MPGGNPMRPVNRPMACRIRKRRRNAHCRRICTRSPLETLPRPWWRRSRLPPGPRRRRMHTWRAARRRRRRPMPRQRKSWPRPGQQAESLLEQARTQKAAMERETREVSSRLRGEMQRLNKFMVRHGNGGESGGKPVTRLMDRPSTQAIAQAREPLCPAGIAAAGRCWDCSPWW